LLSSVRSASAAVNCVCVRATAISSSELACKRHIQPLLPD
jgi:hypothetical protein